MNVSNENMASSCLLPKIKRKMKNAGANFCKQTKMLAHNTLKYTSQVRRLIIIKNKNQTKNRRKKSQFNLLEVDVEFEAEYEPIESLPKLVGE